MKNLPLLLKHTVILMGVMLISVAILVWYSVTHMMNYSEREIAESSLAETKANQELTDKVMENIVDHSVRIASSALLNSMQETRSIASMSYDTSNVNSAATILKELYELNKINPSIYSSFIYMEDADYIISTDKGITALHNYESIHWMNTALEKSEGVQGVWFSRWDQTDEKSILSYVLPLHSLSSTMKGSLVVNILETEFTQYLSSNQTGFNEYILINENGFIISHVDQAMLFKNIVHEPFFNHLFNERQEAGYTYREQDRARQLVTWSRSVSTGWLNVNIYEVSKQMAAIYRLQKSIYILAFIMIIFGSLFSLIVTKRLSVPIKKLVMMVNHRLHYGDQPKNELNFLEEAFERMQDEAEELQQLLNESKQATNDIALQQLIRGEVTEQARTLFKRRNFIVAILSIDAYRQYMIKHGSEARSYHRYKWIAAIDRLSMEHTKLKCVDQGDGYYVIFINSDNVARLMDQEALSELIKALQLKAVEIFHQSITISVSDLFYSIHDVQSHYISALEGLKRRLLQGYGHIYYGSSTSTADDEQNHFYPNASEKKLLSYIDQCNFDSAKQEIANVWQDFSNQMHIAPDQVLYICHQLVGVTLTHLREKNVNVQHLFSSHRNIYTQLAISETLDDVEAALVSFYEDIISHLLELTAGEGTQYGHKIIHYLDNNYRKDIVFEEMAEEIGISYSYMRKIITQVTGMTLGDYVHAQRIKQAKKLLRSSELTIKQIAEEVGYNNIRSFNRFFQKVEHMTPSVYRSQQHQTMNRNKHVLN